MAKNFSELRARMAAQAQERSAAQAERLLAAMPLNELHPSRGL